MDEAVAVLQQAATADSTVGVDGGAPPHPGASVTVTVYVDVVDELLAPPAAAPAAVTPPATLTELADLETARVLAGLDDLDSKPLPTLPAAGPAPRQSSAPPQGMGDCACRVPQNDAP